MAAVAFITGGASGIGAAIGKALARDYLFNNAGIGVAGEIAGYTLPDWYDVFDVNLRGVVHGIGGIANSKALSAPRATRHNI